MINVKLELPVSMVSDNTSFTPVHVYEKDTVMPSILPVGSTISLLNGEKTGVLPDSSVIEGYLWVEDESFIRIKLDEFEVSVDPEIMTIETYIEELNSHGWLNK